MASMIIERVMSFMQGISWGEKSLFLLHLISIPYDFPAYSMDIHIKNPCLILDKNQSSNSNFLIY